VKHFVSEQLYVGLWRLAGEGFGNRVRRRHSLSVVEAGFGDGVTNDGQGGGERCCEAELLRDDEHA